MKYVIIGAIFLTLILASLGLVLFFLSQNPQRISLGREAQTTPTIAPAKTVHIYFLPNTVTLDSQASESAQADLMIDPGGNEIDITQVELKYNPDFFQDLKINERHDPEFVNNYQVVLNEIDPTLGRISFAIKLKPEGKSMNTPQKLGTFYFDVSPTMTATSLRFLPQSLVTHPTSRQNLLLEPAGLKIIKEASPSSVILPTSFPSPTPNASIDL